MNRYIPPAALAAALALLAADSAVSQESSSETYRQLNLFGDVFERVRAAYVEEVTDQQLIENAIDGMLSRLDPHSSYLTEEDFADMQVQTKGEFGGLGIEVTMENGLVRVVSPIDDTPAFRAGIQPGDYIVLIDDTQVFGLNLSEAVDLMRGPVDSDVTLTIQRGEAEPFEVTLTRAVITIQSVRSRLEGEIGYVRITSFSEQTDAGLREAVAKMTAESDGSLDGLVLDLRNNPGGLLDQAIAVVDDFIEQGEIVSTRGRDENAAQRFNAEPGDIAAGVPIVVLINSGSASASEIVAGALQDHQRAILLGTRSFGKGSVQTVIPLPGHGAIRLTTARYFTPSGRSIQGDGISPDIEVVQATIEPIEAAERHEADLPGALSNPTEGESEEAAPAEATETPDGDSSQETAPDETQPAETAEGEAPPEDYQLARALDLLRGLALIKAQSE